jgi:outer membrane receptor protein involved in Fe transport
MPRLLICILLAAAAAFGQGSASVVGTVTDASGGVVPAAELTLTNEATGVARAAKADSGGRFDFIRVPVGNYRLSASASGFKRAEMRAVNLTAEQTLQLNLALELGEVNQSVDVSDAYTALETATSTLRSVVRRELIEDLPLNGRNALQLQTLLPGAVRQAGARASFSQEDGISVNGSRGNDNNTLVDGGHNNDVYTGVPTSVPNPDALQEFSVLSNNFSAEYGRGSGSIVSAVTKSGTNQIHGTAYEFLRNDVMDARSFFAHANLVDKQRLRRNQFGASIGGPLLRDRTFWFASWESLRESRAVTQSGLLVPTPLERAGDFSATARKPTDPLAGNQPFPGNVIPANRQSQAARKMADVLIPLPNFEGSQFVYNSPSSERRDQLMARGDHNFSSNDRLYVSYFFANLDQIQNFNIPLANGQGSWTNNRILANYTKVVSPLIVNAFTYTFNHLGFARGPVPILPDKYPGNPPTVASGLRLSDLGVQTKSATPQYPMNTRLGAIAGYFAFNGENFVEFFPNAHEVRNLATWTRGAHMIKFGGEYAYSRAERNASNESDGNTFAWNATRANNGYGEFLLGLPSSYTQQSLLRTDNRFHTIGLFIQDDWKAGRSFTLNLGLRWEPGLGIYDGRDEIASFRPGQQSAQYPKAPRGLVYPGDTGITRSTYPSDWNNLAPRAGFAWQPLGPNSRTVVRSGYGIFYNAIRGFLLNEAQIAQPFVLRIVRQAPPSFENPWLNFAGGDPFPFSPPSTGAEKSAYSFVVPTGIQRNFDPKNATTYNQQWHGTIQHEAAGTVFTAAYVGSKGTRLMINYEQNQAIYGPGATAGNVDQRRPYRDFQTINTAAAIGNSTYHSVQLSANRRLSRGLYVMANYTRSKALDLQSLDRNAGIIQDTRNFAADKGLADFHRDHLFVATFLAEIPSKWRRGFAGVLTSGWQTNGIFNYASGQPLTVVPGTDRALSGGGTQRADVKGEWRLSTGRSFDEQRAAYFRTQAFTPAAIGSFGNSARNLVIGPGGWNLDLGIFKTTPINERFRVQLRWELFNAFNHANLGSPVVAVNSSAFGQINTVTGPRIMQAGLKVRF